MRHALIMHYTRVRRLYVTLSREKSYRKNRKLARKKWGHALSSSAIESLKLLSVEFGFSIPGGDLLLLEKGWYVTHSGLIRLARRSRCDGIVVHPVREFCNPTQSRWAFEATVYRSRTCRGFVGYGDADPSNVSSLVLGA